MSNYKGEDRLEKHYTPTKFTDLMWKIREEFIKFEITEWLENSAGSGNLMDYIKERSDAPIIAFDIFNETAREDIKQVDYLKHKIDYKPGRVAFINPPFQKGLKFLYKALSESDYVIALLSANSLLNIDYSKVWAEEIYFVKKAEFENCKQSIIIIGCRKKLEGEKYEWE